MTLSIGILVYPGVQQLDLTGPFEVFVTVPGTQMHLVWRDTTPLVSSTGLILAPTTTFADCPALDVLCVPGGAGINSLLKDAEVVDFVRRQAEKIRIVTAVCTGALLLGAAGLLKGRRATTHWMVRDLLAAFGAVPTNARVERDGNLFTAGGVTAGIDLGLAVVADLVGRDQAEAVQLQMEYAPEPPFSAGSPDTAPPEVLALVRQRLGPSRRQREKIIAELAAPQAFSG
jgi:cyclohexyl-isocyanide hydratase